ncbi:MAG: hypothetical protein ACI8S6_003666 [Myxococcota bacterium]
MAAGDLNNDGQDEIIVTGYHESGKHTGSGRVHAIFEVGTGEHNLSDLSSATVTWDGRYAAQNLGSPGFDWIYQPSSGARADIYLGALKSL